MNRILDKSKPYPHEVQRKLVIAAQQGSDLAKNELTTSNMRFVYRVACKYQSSRIPFEDLLNEGLVGLTLAIDRFDPNSGNTFLTYAVFWIRARITMHIRDKSRLIRKSANMTDSKKYPDIKTLELSHKFDGDIFSIEEKIEQTQFDSPESELEVNDVRRMIEDLINELDPIDQEIIKRHYGFTGAIETCSGIAASNGYSKERIRQRHMKVLQNFRNNPRFRLILQ